MRPSEMLVGRLLPGNWKVTAFAKRSPKATGGNFSTGYLVENADGRKGFLKAMDYIAAFQQPNTAEMLQWMTNAYLFEKNVCAKCRDNYLRRVVHAIESGFLQTDPSQPFSKVEYLIFELANGDVRAHLDAQGRFDLAFVMRTLHNVATGLDQLHRADIAHQDLKPSNVLIFDRDNGSKISDFGRAWAKDFPAPHDNLQIAGDQGYAPPEQMYGEISKDAQNRRFGCDTYHLGSLVVFFFSRVHMNALIGKYLAPEHQPYSWGSTYAEVLPYVQAAFAAGISEFSAMVPGSVRSELIEIVLQLCDPDLPKRGHPLNRQGHTSQFALERYVSRFDLLAKKAELSVTTGRY